MRFPGYHTPASGPCPVKGPASEGMFGALTSEDMSGVLRGEKWVSRLKGRGTS